MRLEDVEIKYDRPKVPVFGDFLIVFAPIVACAMILVLISALLGDPVNVKTALPKDIEFTAKGFFQFSKDLIDAIKVTLFGLWKEADVRDGRWIGFIIATIIFTVSMAPQRGDLKYLVPGIIIIAAIPFFLGKFGIVVSLWATKRLEHFWVIVNLAGCMLLCILFLSSISIGIYQVVRLTLSKKRPGE